MESGGGGGISPGESVMGLPEGGGRPPACDSPSGQLLAALRARIDRGVRTRGMDATGGARCSVFEATDVNDERICATGGEKYGHGIGL